MRICVWVFHTVGAVHEPAEGLPAWAYIVVSALVLAAQIVTAIWINTEGREGSGDARRDNEQP
mgnify:CR=1 FL=1